jgi:hypothetical protein
MGKLFVTVFAFAPATRTIPADRGTRTSHQYSQSNFCTLTNYWLRDKLYRDTAPVPATNFVTGDKFAASIKLVGDTRSPHKNLYLDAKNRATPSLHRDNFLAPLARGT